MASDIFPGLSWAVYKHHLIGNIAYFIATVCYFLIFYKLFSTKDGLFRTALLYFFGSLLVHSAIMTVFYNPLYNFWIHAFSKIPVLFSVVNLTIFMIREFGIGGKIYD